ncbi:MAG: polysaccharide deacetylase family protein, partial [Geminicoccaceae bacterium]
AWLQPNVQGQIAASPEVIVLQHGFDHANHARKGAKSIELGGRAPAPIMKALHQGFATLEDAFGAGFLPVLVPPWNRIDSALHTHLVKGGYLGLSVFGKRADPEIVPGLSLVNTHVDPVDWRGTRGYLGDEVTLNVLIDQLKSEEPIGILSHHLVMDEACWNFLDRLFAILLRHPAARLCSAPHVFTSSRLSSGHAA